MSGYCWAKTPQGELFVVLVVDGKGYLPGVEGDIDLTEIAILEPVKWPSQIAPQNQPSGLPNYGALAAGAAPECVILPFVANG